MIWAVAHSVRIRPLKLALFKLHFRGLCVEVCCHYNFLPLPPNVGFQLEPEHLELLEFSVRGEVAVELYHSSNIGPYEAPTPSLSRLRHVAVLLSLLLHRAFH